MKRLLALVGLTLVSSALFLGGCNSVGSKTSTVVHADGTFERTVELDAPFEFPTRQSHPSSKLTRARARKALRKDFGLPSTGGKLAADLYPVASPPPKMRSAMARWTSHKAYARGESAIHDVILKSPKGEAVVANEAYVRPLGDGRWIFEERYHWIGRPIPDGEFLCPTLRTVVKRSLGEGAATSEIDSFSERLLKWFFDPHSESDNPPEKTEAAKEAGLANSLTPICRNDREFRASQAIAHWFYHMSKKDSDAASAFLASRNWPNQAVNVDVRVPGHVVQSDANRDNKGRLSWSFMPVAAASKDVVLTVVYKP